MNRNLLLVLAIVAALILAGLYFNVVSASGCCKTTNITNNYLTETTITSGVSDKKLAEGLSAAFAAGGHQFDYSTSDWQGSIVGAWESHEHENAVSFGIGKRFTKMDALLHGSFTQAGDTEYVTFGGTFRF